MRFRSVTDCRKVISMPAILLRLVAGLAVWSVVTSALLAQGPTQSEPDRLLQQMVGRWVMSGTIAKKAVTHDVDVDWLLKRQYIRLHEVSREQGVDGAAGYEAWIFIAWDAKASEFAVLWLDNTETTNFAPEGIGHAKLDGDKIPFVWKLADGSGIHTTFAYDRVTDSWSWTIQNVDRSATESPFASLTLVRKK